MEEQILSIKLEDGKVNVHIKEGMNVLEALGVLELAKDVIKDKIASVE